MATQKREVSGFHRVRLQDLGLLRIAQGTAEALTVEADDDVLDKVFAEVRDGVLVLRMGRDWLERLSVGLQTSLTRPHIQYHLTVKDLDELVLAGAGRIDVGALTTPRLNVELSGAGDISFQMLSADELRVTLTGAGRVEIAGKVKQQMVSMSGAGEYAASKLESQKARVTVSGAGSAGVWVVESLDTIVRDLGSVEYVGNPTVKKSVTGMGGIRPPRPPRPPV
jgi:hypothetical protein